MVRSPALRYGIRSWLTMSKIVRVLSRNISAVSFTSKNLGRFAPTSLLLFITSILVLIVSPQPPAYRLFFPDRPRARCKESRRAHCSSDVPLRLYGRDLVPQLKGSVRARLNCPHIFGYLVKD